MTTATEVTGNAVTLNQLPTATTPVAGADVIPYQTATGTYVFQATVAEVGNAIGVFTGSGAPTSTTVTHPAIYLRTDGSTTNDRAYITTSTGGWVAFITAS